MKKFLFYLHLAFPMVVVVLGIALTFAGSVMPGYLALILAFLMLILQRIDQVQDHMLGQWEIVDHAMDALKTTLQFATQEKKDV